jgi:hypothetical protein
MSPATIINVCGVSDWTNRRKVITSFISYSGGSLV